MRRAATVVVAVLAAMAAAGARAGDIRFGTGFSPGDLSTMVDVVSDAVVFPNLGPAEPTGLVGFEVLAAAGGPRADTGSHWWKNGVSGDTTLGVLNGSRIIVRKGLPLRFDVGVQSGEVLGQRFWGVEGRWALLEGGVVSPALALRASHSWLDGPLDLKVDEAQLVLSKGFAMLTPYAAVGYRRGEGRATIGDLVARRYAVTESRATAAAGVRLGLPVFRVVAEVRRGAETGYFIGVGVGL